MVVRGLELVLYLRDLGRDVIGWVRVAPTKAKVMICRTLRKMRTHCQVRLVGRVGLICTRKKASTLACMRRCGGL